MESKVLWLRQCTPAFLWSRSHFSFANWFSLGKHSHLDIQCVHSLYQTLSMKISDNWISANNLTFEKLKSQLNLTARAYVWGDIHTRRRFPEFVCNSDLISLRAELENHILAIVADNAELCDFQFASRNFFFVPFLKWQSLLICLSITASVTVSTILDAELSTEWNIRFNVNRPKLVYHKQTASTEETIKSDMNTNGISISVGDVRNGNFAFVFTMFCLFFVLWDNQIA